MRQIYRNEKRDEVKKSYCVGAWFAGSYLEHDEFDLSAAQHLSRLTQPRYGTLLKKSRCVFLKFKENSLTHDLELPNFHVYAHYFLLWFVLLFFHIFFLPLYIKHVYKEPEGFRKKI